MTFKDGAHLNKTNDVVTGKAMPAAPSLRKRSAYNFKGWFTGEKGTGAQWYGANNRPLVDVFLAASDVTLYAHWVQKDGITEVLYVNGEEVIDGVTKNGNGWSYSEETGRLVLSSKGKAYTITGTLTDGTVSVVIPPNGPTNVTLKNLTLTTAEMKGYSPFVISNSCTMTLPRMNSGTS